MTKKAEDGGVYMDEEDFVVQPGFSDEDGVQTTSGIGKDGKEYPDPVPSAPPVGYNPPPDLMQMIRTMVHHELGNAVLQSAGVETFEEADDFDIPDEELDPLTPYERVFDPSDAPPPAKVPAAAPAGVANPPPPPPQPTAGKEGGQGGASLEPAPSAPPSEPASTST